MLQQRLNDCKTLMAEVAQNKSMQTRSIEVAKKNNIFFDAYDQFFPILVGVKIIQDNQLLNLSIATQELLKRCKNETSEAFNSKVVRYPDQFKRNVNDLDTEIKKEWHSYAESCIAQIQGDLGVLKLVCNNKKDVDILLKELGDYTEWPITAYKLDTYKEASKKATIMLKDMHFDEEVDAFLRKVRDKNATLSDLTPSIFKWITDEGLLDNISIEVK